MNQLRKHSSDLFQADSSLEVGVAGGLAFFAVACFVSESMQIIILGTLVAFLAGAAVARALEARRERRRWDDVLRMLPIPFALATEPRFFGEYVRIADALTKVVKHSDLLFQELARGRIENVATDLATLARGEVVFDGTETWRTAYQRVLETLRVKTYYSVAWVRTNDYWNDAPGRQSMRLNYEMVGRGFRIERVHILPDELWPFDEKMPTGGILEWLVEQQGRGIVVSLVRESDLAGEPDLLADFAIYGDRGVGTQELDERSHTLRYVLSFDQAAIRHALERWERLALFARSFQNLLDQ